MKPSSVAQAGPLPVPHENCSLFPRCVIISSRMLAPGTTSRQLQIVSRWAMSAVVGIGAMALWWPSAAAWGGLAGGLVLVFFLWLMAKTARGSVSVPAGLFHLALAGPAAILAMHFVRHSRASQGLYGALDVSAIYQFALIALGAALAQDLYALPLARGAAALLAGAGLVAGSLAGALWGRADMARTPLGLLAMCGMAVWLSILYSRPFRPPAGPARKRFSAHWLAVAAVCVLAATAVAIFPREGILAGVVLAACAALAGLAGGGWRIRAMTAACLLLAGGVAAEAQIFGLGQWWRQVAEYAGLPLAAPPTLGAGEEAYATLGTSATGLAYLCGQVGGAGAGWLAAGLLIAGGLSLWRGRRGGELLPAVLRLWAAGLAAAAMLSPLGLFVPSVSLAMAFTWGLLAAPGAPPARRWSGWVLIGCLGAVLFLLAISPEPGLLEWTCESAGLHDDFLHVVCGALFAAVLAWQMGGGKAWRGLLAVTIAMAAGAAGEGAQYFLTDSRNAEMRDFLFHCAGCAAGATPYFLALGSRMWEEPA
jgi:hypothetical protein